VVGVLVGVLVGVTVLVGLTLGVTVGVFVWVGEGVGEGTKVTAKEHAPVPQAGSEQSVIKISELTVPTKVLLPGPG
jgi:hypothetical protein